MGNDEKADNDVDEELVPPSYTPPPPPIEEPTLNVDGRESVGSATNPGPPLPPRADRSRTGTGRSSSSPKGKLSAVTVTRARHKNCPRSSLEDDSWNTGSQCCFGFLMLLTQVFLFGSLGLVIVWIFYFRQGVAWQDDIAKEFNLHPLLMVGGFIFLLGQAILVYRGLRCCRKIYNKLVHTILHLLVMPAAAIAVVAVFDFHRLSPIPIPDLYSLHSWMGLTTLGLFSLQFVVGFFSFLVLLCCEQSTARFRASLLPLHVHFGLATFLLGIATCLTGLTEKAIFQLGPHYAAGTMEGRVINALGLTLIVLAVLMTYIVRTDRYRRATVVVINERL